MSAFKPALCIGDSIKPLPAEYDIVGVTPAAGAVSTCKATNRVDGQVFSCRVLKKAGANLESLYQARLATLHEKSLRGNSFLK